MFPSPTAKQATDALDRQADNRNALIILVRMMSLLVSTRPTT